MKIIFHLLTVWICLVGKLYAQPQPFAQLPIASQVQMERITGSTFSTVQDMHNILNSTGIISGGIINDIGGGNITVDAGVGAIRAVNDPTASIFHFNWSALGSTVIPLDSERVVGISYNAGSPIVVIKNTYVWDFNTEFPLGFIVNEGGTLFVYPTPHETGDGLSKVVNRLFDTETQQRDERAGGLIISELGTRNIALTAGAIWEKLNRFPISAINTSVADTFDRYFRDGVGGHTKQSAQTQWNNIQYDDGSGILATISNNRFAVQWFYIDITGAITSAYGTAEYTSLALAEAEMSPSDLPIRIKNHGTLVGRIVFQESVATGNVETVFDTMFVGAQVTDHGSLAGLTDPLDHSQHPLIIDLASIAVGEGASTIGIEDVGANFTAIEVEGALSEVGIHIGDGTIHFTQGAISILEAQISDLLHAPVNHASRHENAGADPVDHDILQSFVLLEHVPHSAVDLTAGAGLSGGGDISVSRSFSTASQEAAFLADGAAVNLTCGASNQGKMQVMDDGSLQICDGATTSVLRSFQVEAALDHGSITGLINDDHPGNAWLAGRVGGQILIGGTAAGEDLTLQSTSNATRGSIFFGANSAYDQVNDRLGLGTTVPDVVLDLPGHDITKNKVQIGTLGIQSTGVNNGFLQGNGFFDGTTERYREDGPISMLQFLQPGGIAQIRIRGAISGLAGNIATLIDVATFIIDTKRVGIGTVTPISQLEVSDTGVVQLYTTSTDGDAVQWRLRSDSVNRRFIAVNNLDQPQTQLVFGDNGKFEVLGPTSANIPFTISAGAPSNSFFVDSGGDVGTGTNSPEGQFEISTVIDEATQALTIDQNDADQAFTDYQGTSAANTTNNITTFTTGNSIQGFVRQEINGVVRWMPFYDAPTS